jgi:hypothetical protein
MQKFILITVIVFALGCGKKSPEGNGPDTLSLADLFDSNSTGDSSSTGDSNSTDNEYKTSPELKAKVDKYFGTGNAIVRLFVATDGQLILTGNEVPLLFTELSKDQLNPKPTAGLSKFIEVYQPQSTSGFEGLKWEPADPSVLASSGVELLYGRSVAGNGGISIVGVPKWDSAGMTEPSEKFGVPWRLYQNKVARFFGVRFRIQVKHNAAIRVKASGKTVIIYLLSNPGVFFDGLFDDAIEMPIGATPPKVLIDPYLINALNKLIYKGATSGGFMVQPETYLKQGVGREWVAFTDDLNDGTIEKAGRERAIKEASSLFYIKGTEANSVMVNKFNLK